MKRKEDSTKTKRTPLSKINKQKLKLIIKITKDPEILDFQIEVKLT